MTSAMTKLAAGDTESEVPARDNTDEIGEMARAVEVFRQQAIENGRPVGTDLEVGLPGLRSERVSYPPAERIYPRAFSRPARKRRIAGSASRPIAR
jgi:hypothetical protein